MPPEIWQSIASAGLPSLLMAVAVWWLQKVIRELLTELRTERNERLDAMDNHIKECDKDRRELRQEHNQLQSEFRQYLATK